MKKLVLLLIALLMLFSVTACGTIPDAGGNTPNGDTQQGVSIPMTKEGIVGVWAWQEEKSSGLTSTRKFELYIDGTGKIISSTVKENENATFEWNIENETLNWFSVSVNGFGRYNMVLSQNYLVDLTWSDFFIREE